MKEFIEEISKRYDIKRKDLLEKDILIHRILLDLSRDDFFSQNLVFKGGTCLIKCYLGYYRFSEDIDFTWKDQSIFDRKSSNEMRKIISDIKDRIGELLVKVSEKRGMDFRLEKDNREYMEFGGGNKTVTYKIWFNSEILKRRSFIKIQINFVDMISFDVKKRKLGCLISDEKDRELEVFYGDDYRDYIKNISFLMYDVKEILCEKVRAILTRRGVKARDFADIFLIEEEFGLNVQDLQSEIIEKAVFVLDLYKKYRRNIAEKIKLIDSEELFIWGEEKDLLLIDIDEKKFYRFVSRLNSFLQIVYEKVNMAMS